MAKKIGMITGANAKIVIGATTMAYATDVEYNIDIQTIPVEVMNRAEVVANVPIAYYVNGSFSVVRYTEAAKNAKEQYTANASNSPENWKSEDKQNNLGKHFDPGKLLESTTVDIVLYQRYSVTSGSETTVKFLKITNCRLTRRTASVNKRSVMIENFSFVGEMCDDDVIVAAASGETDLST